MIDLVGVAVHYEILPLRRALELEPTESEVCEGPCSPRCSRPAFHRFARSPEARTALLGMQIKAPSSRHVAVFDDENFILHTAFTIEERAEQGEVISGA